MESVSTGAKTHTLINPGVPLPASTQVVTPFTPGSVSMHRRRTLLLVGLALADLICALGAVILAGQWVGATSNAVMIAPLVVIAFLAARRMYDWNRLFWGANDFSGIASVVTHALVAVLAVGYLFQLPDIVSPVWLLAYGTAAVTLVSGGRLFFRLVVGRLHSVGVLAKRTLIVGDNTEAQLLLKRMKRGVGLEPVGYIGRDQHPREKLGDLPYLGPIRKIDRILERSNVDAVLVAASSLTYLQVKDIMRATRGHVTDVHIAAGLYEIIPNRVLVKEVAGMPMTTVRPVSFGLGSALVKRSFDLVVSSILVLMLSPLFLLVAALIATSSRGGVFFRQDRVGKNGKIFKMLKFRSMAADSDDRVHQEMVKAAAEANKLLGDDEEEVIQLHKPEDDPRITGIGRWLRKYSIDELPQLLNVIKGEMSLVGPRPVPSYEPEVWDDWMNKRLLVTPGMSGLWQVSGRSQLSYYEMIKLDLYYIENWSLLLDLSILVRTIPAVLTSRGAV